jgi:hypothetical protein
MDKRSAGASATLHRRVAILNTGRELHDIPKIRFYRRLQPQQESINRKTLSFAVLD